MKTQLRKPSRTKARYTEEYKQEALELWRAKWPQRGESRSRAGDSPTVALSLGPAGARIQRIQERIPTWTQRRRTGGGDPPLTRRERQTFRAA